MEKGKLVKFVVHHGKKLMSAATLSGVCAAAGSIDSAKTAVELAIFGAALGLGDEYGQNLIGKSIVTGATAGFGMGLYSGTKEGVIAGLAAGGVNAVVCAMEYFVEKRMAKKWDKKIENDNINTL